MERRDVTAPRTLNDLELRHGFGKSFAELMGVSNDARILAEQAEETATKADEKATEAITKVVGPNGIVATLGLRYDDVLQKSVIEIGANTLYITTDKFSLTGDGTIKAEGGYIGGWSIGKEGIFKSFLGLEPDEDPDSLNFVSSTFFIAPPINYQTSHVIRLEMNRKEVFHVLSNGEISSNKIISSYTENDFSRSASLEDGILNLYSSVMVSEGYELAYYQYGSTQKFMIYVDKTDSILKAKRL